jgi:hypothetical protein
MQDWSRQTTYSDKITCHTNFENPVNIQLKSRSANATCHFALRAVNSIFHEMDNDGLLVGFSPCEARCAHRWHSLSQRNNASRIIRLEVRPNGSVGTTTTGQISSAIAHCVNLQELRYCKLERADGSLHGMQTWCGHI